ncbi:MAG: phosphatase PAP2 family protein [Burkholderiales bacterium]
MRNLKIVLPAFGAIVVLAFGAVLKCSAPTCSPPVWDADLLEWFAAWRSPALDSLFTTVTWLGSLWMLAPLAMLMMIGMSVHRQGAKALRFAVAFAGASALGYAAKFLIGRERPALLDPTLSLPPNASFPSGHAMQITAFALATVWLFAPSPQRRLWLGVALILILLVGLSRLYLQMHFPSDVLAGTMAAALWTFAFTCRERKRHA